MEHIGRVQVLTNGGPCHVSAIDFLLNEMSTRDTCGGRRDGGEESLVVTDALKYDDVDTGSAARCLRVRHAPCRFRPEPLVVRFHGTSSQAHHYYDPVGLGFSASGALPGEAMAENSLALTSPRQPHFTPPNSSPRQSMPPLHHFSHSHPYSTMNHISDSDASLIDTAPCPYAHYTAHPSQWTSFYNSYVHASPSTSPYSSFHSSGTHSGVHLSPALGYSPQQTPIPLHSVGPVFSETFMGNYITNEPLSYSPPPMHSQLDRSPSLPHADAYARAHPTVDFTSLRRGVLSPALSDASPHLGHSPLRAPPIPADSPLLSDLDTFDAFDDGSGDNGLALFGGIQVDDPLAFEDVHDVHGYTELTPRASPILRSMPLQPSLSRSPRPRETSLLGTQYPPTPRMSPLLSDF